MKKILKSKLFNSSALEILTFFHFEGIWSKYLFLWNMTSNLTIFCKVIHRVLPPKFQRPYSIMWCRDFQRLLWKSCKVIYAPFCGIFSEVNLCTANNCKYFLYWFLVLYMCRKPPWFVSIYTRYLYVTYIYIHIMPVHVGSVLGRKI